MDGDSIGLAVLDSLERKRALLGPRARGSKLVLFSGGGFDRHLRERARARDDVELVDLERLYAGE